MEEKEKDVLKITNQIKEILRDINGDNKKYISELPSGRNKEFLVLMFISQKMEELNYNPNLPAYAQWDFLCTFIGNMNTTPTAIKVEWELNEIEIKLSTEDQRNLQNIIDSANGIDFKTWANKSLYKTLNDLQNIDTSKTSKYSFCADDMICIENMTSRFVDICKRISEGTGINHEEGYNILCFADFMDNNKKLSYFELENEKKDMRKKFKEIFVEKLVENNIKLDNINIDTEQIH